MNTKKVGDVYVVHQNKPECLQIGEMKADHSQFLRAENDSTTPRTPLIASPAEAPSSDLLFQVTAAYAAGALALQGAGGSSQLAQRATTKAKELFEIAREHPGLYTESNEALLQETGGSPYTNDGWESFGLWAASWMYRLSEDEAYKKVWRLVSGCLCVCFCC